MKKVTLLLLALTLFAHTASATQWCSVRVLNGGQIINRTAIPLERDEQKTYSFGGMRFAFSAEYEKKVTFTLTDLAANANVLEAEDDDPWSNGARINVAYKKPNSPFRYEIRCGYEQVKDDIDYAER